MFFRMISRIVAAIIKAISSAHTLTTMIVVPVIADLGLVWSVEETVDGAKSKSNGTHFIKFNLKCNDRYTFIMSLLTTNRSIIIAYIFNIINEMYMKKHQLPYAVYTLFQRPCRTQEKHQK